MSEDVYRKGDYKVVEMGRYNCHPETCCHDEHYRYCIQRITEHGAWRWWAYEDDLMEAKRIVDRLS